jgi:cell division protein FtsI/penicillin-binding protein 2
MVLRLYFLQIVHHEQYVNEAGKQRVKGSDRSLNRGAIFFETKDKTLISAATEKKGYTVALVPKVLENATTTFEKLSVILELEKEDFFAKATKKNDPYEEIARKIPEDKANQIKALKIPGVGVYSESWRFYPGGRQASHVVGLLGYKGEEYAGRYGLERFYEKTLSRDSEDLFANFFVEIFSNVKNTITSSEGEGNIVSTIEPTTQSSLEETLRKIQNKWSSAETGGIIIDPMTGEIYAMASIPDFDPNDFRDVEDPKVFSNPLVEEVREMGSIIKPLTVAAGLNERVITANSTYFDNGSITLNTETIYNHDKKTGRGQTTIQDALGNSLNMGMVFVMQKLGREKFSTYMLDFGLGERTGIDLPNEAQSLVSNLQSPRDIEHATASFGQGIALTPVATVRALSTIGNGGILITPHVVKKIQFTNGLSKTLDYKEGRRVITKETSNEITRMLVELVDTNLLDGKAKNPHYSIAAKTGTAQIANSTDGGYYKDRYLHSFFGYFPAYEPKFLVFLYTVYPKNVSFASNTLAEPFFDLSKFLINYYEVTPDR